MEFKVEELTNDLLDEMMPLLEKHYKEIAVYQDIPLVINRKIYLELEVKDLLRVYTAREKGSRKLLGYSVFIINHNIHYSTSLEAKNDVIFIDPEHRGFGAKFIKYCDEQLQAEQVQTVYHHIKPDHDWSKLICKMGYRKFETIYAKRLDKESSWE